MRLVPANLGIGPFGHIVADNVFGSVGDLRLIPDPRTRCRIAGVPGRPPLTVMLADTTTTDGTLWDSCPRGFARRALADLESEFGLRVLASFEHEFIMTSPNGPADAPFSLQALRRGEPLGTDLMRVLKGASLEPEMWLPEYGAHQWEVPLAPADGLTAADRAILVRDIVRDMVHARGGAASFAPLIDPDGSGSGVHVHLSLRDEVAAAGAWTVTRLEAVAEQLVGAGTSAASFVADYASALEQATTGAVGVKTIIAYRYGLDFDPVRPSIAATTDAAGRWLARCESGGRVRVDDPVVLRHLLWAAVDRGLPIQVHVGYGDADLDLHRCNPLLMTRWLRAIQSTGVAVMLLHCYPYQREAGYLAHVFPNVYCDVGLAVNYTGSRSAHIIAESLELTPFHKSLFSSDAFGLPELYLTGAVLFRRGLARVLDEWVRDGDWTAADAARVAQMIASGTARRVYRLDG